MGVRHFAINYVALQFGAWRQDGAQVMGRRPKGRKVRIRTEFFVVCCNGLMSICSDEVLTMVWVDMPKISSFFSRNFSSSSSSRNEPSTEGGKQEKLKWQYGPNGHIHSAQAESSSYQGVYIDQNSSDEFRSSTRESLDRIGRTPAGSTTLHHIASINEMNPRKKVLITPDSLPPKGSHALPGWERPGNSFSELQKTLYARTTGDDFMPRVSSEGCDVGVVTYNVDHGERFTDDTSAYGVPDPSLSYAYLGHELIHASRKLHGEELDDPDRLCEELRTAGVGPWSNEYPSENAIRRENGLFERPNYSGETGEGIGWDVGNSEYTNNRLTELQATYGHPHGWSKRYDSDDE